MMNFSATFDPLSLETLSRFERFDLMGGPIQAEMDYSSELILRRMIMYMNDRFMNPSGRLAGSFTVNRYNSFTREIESDEPYAHRREESFKGPDVLGRMSPNDPAAHYARDAVADSSEEVGARMVYAIEASFRRLGGGATNATE